jgi:hypothetical protein
MSQTIQGRVSPEYVAKLLSTVTPLPRLWIGVMCVIAVVAALDMATTEAGALRWHISVGAVSLIAIGLIWLPSALAFIFLAGGSFKAAGAEVSTTGLLTSPDELVGDLANLRTTTEAIGQQGPDARSTVRKFNTAIDSMASRYLPADSVLSEDILSREARAYEEIRRTMSPGDARTSAMNKLVNEVRIRASAAPATAKQYAATFLRSARAGDRIVGLGVVEGAPSADEFGDVLRIFSTSASAFEQYHSLQALNSIAPVLTAPQRHEAITVLEAEKADPRGVELMKDRYIPSWIDRVVKEMKAGSST